MKHGHKCRYFRGRVCVMQAKVLTVKDGVVAKCTNCPRRMK